LRAIVDARPPPPDSSPRAAEHGTRVGEEEERGLDEAMHGENASTGEIA
jgi:hypothetical protein